MNYKDIAANLIKKHEGLRLKPYRCTAGKLTIGYGRNLDDNGIREDEAVVMLYNDISLLTNTLEDLSFFSDLSENRKAVLLDMIFNLGVPRFFKFRKMIKALKEGNYDSVAAEMLDSRWAMQVGKRAVELSNIMKTDKIS